VSALPDPLPSPPPQGGREKEAHWPPGATTEDVAEARRLYELTATPVTTILKQFGWTEYRLRKLARFEGWTLRPAVTRGGLAAFRKRIGVELAEYRLNRLIGYGIDILEKEAVDRGVSEAHARTLAALCRAQEIMMRSLRAGTLREKKNKNDGIDFRDDPEWLATEFARRNPGMAIADVRGEGGALQELDTGPAADASR
jgi:hypothetical protein